MRSKGNHLEGGQEGKLAESFKKERSEGNLGGKSFAILATKKRTCLLDLFYICLECHIILSTSYFSLNLHSNLKIPVFIMDWLSFGSQ